MAEKSMKNGSKKRWMGTPISSLYRLISLEDRSDTDEVQILCFRP